MTEQLYSILPLAIVILVVVGVIILIRARRKRENTYYVGSGVTFLVALACVAVMFELILLWFVMIFLAFLISLVLWPRTVELQREETVKQVQETDVSAPFEMKDFLTWKAWIKISARYGYRTMILLYGIVCLAIFAVFGGVCFAVGLFNGPPYGISLVFGPALIALFGYLQFHKALKEQISKKTETV